MEACHAFVPALHREALLSRPLRSLDETHLGEEREKIVLLKARRRSHGVSNGT